MAEAINIHKQLAMGKNPEVRNNAKGSIPKYATGGAVRAEKGIADLPALSSKPAAPPKPTGKIATLKKGGAVPKMMKKTAARGR